MTKHEFLLQATLNGFVGLGHQTHSIGGEYIVRCANNAWEWLESIRKLDEARARNAEISAQLVDGTLEVKS